MKKDFYKSHKQMLVDEECNEDTKMILAHSYVPWQYYDKAFCPQEALMKGTLFPELYGPYKPPK